MEMSVAMHPIKSSANSVVAKSIIILSALLFIAMGAAAVAAPNVFASSAPKIISLPAADILTEGRVMYGGLFIAIGIFLAYTLFDIQRWGAGLVLVMLINALSVAVRAKGILLDGASSQYTLYILTFESVFLVLGIIGYLFLVRKNPDKGTQLSSLRSSPI